MMRVLKSFLKTRTLAFRHAFSGWWYVIRTQRNAWIHAVATIASIAFAVWLQVPLRDIAILILVIALVWTAEFINTALEAVVDLASPDLHPLARVGKDVGAAAVLISAIASILVGILILGPPLFQMILALTTNH